MGVMNALNNSLSSTNTVVKNKADLVVDLLIDTIENVYLIQPLVHLSIYGNKRAKPAIIQHLNGIYIYIYIMHRNNSRSTPYKANIINKTCTTCSIHTPGGEQDRDKDRSYTNDPDFI